jgi:hypothetical protein
MARRLGGDYSRLREKAAGADQLAQTKTRRETLIQISKITFAPQNRWNR